MEREDIEAGIRTAFAGVTLGSGVSLREAQAIDNRIIGLDPDIPADTPEVTDDWTRVADSELARDCLGHLDFAGRRYYLPALLLWLLDHYDDADPNVDMTVIGTISSLAWSPQFDGSHRQTYATFTEDQRAAIASYVEALPRLVRLGREDVTLIRRAFDRYWADFLPGR